MSNGLEEAHTNFCRMMLTNRLGEGQSESATCRK